MYRTASNWECLKYFQSMIAPKLNIFLKKDTSSTEATTSISKWLIISMSISGNINLNEFNIAAAYLSVNWDDDKMLGFTAAMAISCCMSFSNFFVNFITFVIFDDLTTSSVLCWMRLSKVSVETRVQLQPILVCIRKTSPWKR